jgi:hypothetical protein
MSTPAARVGIAVAALAAAVALFFALAGGNDDAATARAVEPQPAAGTQSVTRSASAAPQSASTRRQPTKPARPAKPRIERIWVRGGKTAGGARRLEFKRGELVRFSVHSTTPDEVHIHGFDITKALPANRIVLFTLKADIEGVFEVELHEAGVKIAELRISP